MLFTLHWREGIVRICWQFFKLHRLLTYFEKVFFLIFCRTVNLHPQTMILNCEIKIVAGLWLSSDECMVLTSLKFFFINSYLIDNLQTPIKGPCRATDLHRGNQVGLSHSKKFSGDMTSEPRLSSHCIKLASFKIAKSEVMIFQINGLRLMTIVLPFYFSSNRAQIS